MTYEQTLQKICEENTNVIVMTAENRAAIRNLPAAVGKQFVDVGIAEQTMIGAAAGMALRGRIPVVHALATFLTMRAFEFIRTDVGIGNLPVKLVGAVPGFLSDGNGPTHQAIEDISLMRGIPNMQIFCPADEEELLDALPHIIASPSPCYIRYNAPKPFTEHTVPFAWGVAEQLSEGDDITILTYGFMLKESLAAADILRSQGCSVRLLNLRSLKPIDEEAILRAARETNLVVTIEDHFLTGGLFSIASEILASASVACNIFPVALKHRWFKPALLRDVLEYEGFTGEKLAARIAQQFQSFERSAGDSEKESKEYTAPVFSNH